LYQSGKLDKNTKQRILPCREKIVNINKEYLKLHVDSGSGNVHYDGVPYTEKEISVNFPI